MTMSPREKVARCIIGPRNPVPDSSKFTLNQLRQVKWDAASEAEKSDALWASDAILTALASGSGDHAELVRDLRRADEYGPLGHDGWKAADAIDDLLAENAALRAACDNANGHWKKTQATWSEVLEATGCKDGGELVDRARRATEAERKLDEAVATLKEIAEIDPQPFDGGLDVEAIRTCEECQRYAGHPVQRGICNTHRRPIWDREKHESREEKSLGYRAKSIARTFLSKEAERG